VPGPAGTPHDDDEDVLVRPWWHRQAACAGYPIEWWFPTRGEPTDQAKRICATCPVLGPCREAGYRERFGVWGGVSARGRRRLRVAAQATARLEGTA
jgi:WhiB family redox-sensing transcriptional regulator